MSEQIAHCDWRDFLTVSGDLPADIVEALDKYFLAFAKPGTECPGCGATVFGEDFMDSMLFATFRWGLAHGHGQCGTCGWPAVAHHFINDAGGKEIMALRNFGLIVHPDFVEKREPEAVA